MEFTTHFELQSQATRLVESPSYALLLERRPAKTGLSPSQAPFSKGLGLPPALTGLLQTTTPMKDFQSELFPLHSPLLRESWLVSFPPLINMLKFSGSSCLIGGPMWVIFRPIYLLFQQKKLCLLLFCLFFEMLVACF